MSTQNTGRIRREEHGPFNLSNPLFLKPAPDLGQVYENVLSPSQFSSSLYHRDA